MKKFNFLIFKSSMLQNVNADEASIDNRFKKIIKKNPNSSVKNFIVEKANTPLELLKKVIAFRNDY